MREVAATVRPTCIDGAVTDGRLTLEVAAPTPTLRVRQPGYEPLNETQPIATLALTDDDIELEVELTAAAVETLVDGLATAVARNGEADAD